MKTIKFIALTIAILMVLNTNSSAQNTTEKVKYNTWSVTASAGSMLFYGDLRKFDFYPVKTQDSKDWYNITDGLSEWDRGFGIAVNKQLTSLIGVQGFLQKGAVGGIKPQSNLHFNASFLTYGVNLKVNILPMFNTFLKEPKFAIYGLVGIGFCDFKTHENLISNNALVMSYGYGEFAQEDKKTTETVIPVGFGIKYKINKRFDIGLESTINNLNSDKLDAHVRSGTAKDKYGYTSLTLTYKIGKNEKSLEWVTAKDMEADELAPKFAAINKKIDSLGNKLNEIDNKVNAIQKDVADLKNPAKEADDDGDGVPNSKDLEPGTPKGNLVNFQGITIPKTGSATDLSQPQFSIFFAVNSTVIDAVNEEKIAAAAKMLKANPDLKFDITGHADKTGGQVYNQILSEKRAKVVYDKLVKSYGIDASRLSIVGKGITDPISSDILGVNRRVDFLIKK